MADRKRKPKSFNPAVFFTKVVGVSHKNDDGTSRQKLIRRLKEGEQLDVLRDPDNKYDRNAIVVCAKFGILRRRKQLGFLSAELAEEYAPLLDAGGRIDAEVSSVTGGGGWLWWKKLYGLNIRVTVYAFRTEV